MIAYHGKQEISKPDAMCVTALEKGFLRVDAKAGRAWALRFAGKEVGCRNKRGYIVFTLHLGGSRAQIKMHRLVWIAAHGIIPAGLMPDHDNRVKNDNRIGNLRLVDCKGNAANRRSYSGARNPAAKITKEIADAMRSRHRLLKSYGKVSREFSVSKSLVAQIIRRELWN